MSRKSERSENHIPYENSRYYWKNIFRENGFVSLIGTDDEGMRTLPVEAFLETVRPAAEAENQKQDPQAVYNQAAEGDSFRMVPRELEDCLINARKTEMYLIFFMDSEDRNNVRTWQDRIKRWDNRIMTLVNFGNPGHDIFRNHREIRDIRYNIFQVYLMRGNANLLNRENIMAAERDTRVSRKLFLSLNDREEIISRDRPILPFFFENLAQTNIESMEERIRLNEDLEKIQTRQQLHYLLQEGWEKNTAEQEILEAAQSAALKEWLRK